MVHADGWVDAREQARRIGDLLAARGFAVDRQLYGAAGGVPSPATVVKSLATGVDLALHIGHGTDEGWHACLGPAEREALAVARPAVFFSVGCSTGHFCAEAPYQAYLDDAGIVHRGTTHGEVFTAPPPPPAVLQPGRFNSSGLGERLLRMPHGGTVAYIGCNTGAQPCALTLLEGFTQSLRPAGAHRVGDSWRAALAHYWDAEHLAKLAPDDSWYPASIFFQGMKFMLLGDPTLPLVLR